MTLTVTQMLTNHIAKTYRDIEDVLEDPWHEAAKKDGVIIAITKWPCNYAILPWQALQKPIEDFDIKYCYAMFQTLTGVINYCDSQEWEIHGYVTVKGDLIYDPESRIRWSSDTLKTE